MKTKQVTKSTPKGNLTITLTEAGRVEVDSTSHPGAVLNIGPQTISAIQQLTEEDWKFTTPREDLNAEFDKLPIGAQFRLSADDYQYRKVTDTHTEERYVGKDWGYPSEFSTRSFNEYAVTAGITVLENDRSDISPGDTVRLMFPNGDVKTGLVDDDKDIQFLDEDNEMDFFHYRSNKFTWVEKVDL